MTSCVTVVAVQFGGNQGMLEGGVVTVFMEVYFVISSPFDKVTKYVYDVNKYMLKYFVWPKLCICVHIPSSDGEVEGLLPLNLKIHQ